MRSIVILHKVAPHVTSNLPALPWRTKNQALRRAPAPPKTKGGALLYVLKRDQVASKPMVWVMMANANSIKKVPPILTKKATTEYLNALFY